MAEQALGVRERLIIAASQGDRPAEERREMNARQGSVYVRAAAEQLYFCAQKCRADGHPWPEDLDEAHRLLWEHLGLNEDRRKIVLFGAGGG